MSSQDSSKGKMYTVDINIGGQRWMWIKAIIYGHARLTTDSTRINEVKE